MPITAQYTWKDKKDTIKVLIPTKGVAPSKIDIYVTSSTLKVNMAPYLVDIVLAHPIDPIKHKASVVNGVLNITLIKQSAEEWTSLELSAESALEVKKEAEAKQATLEQELQEKRRDKKIELERFALRNQMSIDEAERTRMDEIKASEKRAAEEEVYAAFAKMEAQPNPSKSSLKKPITSASQAPKSVHFQTSPNTDPSSKVVDVSTPAANSKLSTGKEIFTDEDCVVVDVDDVIAQDDVDIEVASDSGSVDSNDAEVQRKPALSQNDDDDDEYVHVQDDDVRYIPAPRSQGISVNSDAKVAIQFSARVFPTPLRESKMAEEEDWVAKNRKHLKKHGVLGKSVGKGAGNVAEEDPVWLKAKGDDFFRSGDFRSAINAYSAAIDVDDEAVGCFSNRSACYLKLGMPIDCAEDCSAALQLLLVEATACAALDDTDSAAKAGQLSKQRAKLLIRRAAANSQIGKFASAVDDYEATLRELRQVNASLEEVNGRLAGSLVSQSGTAQAASPAVAAIQKEIVAVEADLEKMQLLKHVDSLKQKADTLFAERQLSEAREKYDEALLSLPFHVSCLSNRSACKFALGDVAGCVDDCTTALSILEIDLRNQSSSDSSPPLIGGDNGQGAMLSFILPAPGSDKRKSWVLKTVTRRGAALAQLGRFDEAIQDYSLAAGLDPRNESLRVDLNRIMNYKSGASNTGSTSKHPNPSQTTSQPLHDHDEACCHD